jgi:hypothetical protein
MRLRSRLAKLERAVPARPRGPCPKPGLTAFIVRDAGRADQPVFRDAPPCSVCGQPHVVIEELVVVDGRERFYFSDDVN